MVNSKEVHGAGCHWCNTAEQHYSPVDHTPDGIALFVDDALRRAAESPEGQAIRKAMGRSVRINALDRRGRVIW